MVPKDSAIFSTRPGPRYDHLPRDVDHSNLARFASRSDQDYINLRGIIIDCAEEGQTVIKCRCSEIITSNDT